MRVLFTTLFAVFLGVSVSQTASGASLVGEYAPPLHVKWLQGSQPLFEGMRGRSKMVFFVHTAC